MSPRPALLVVPVLVMSAPASAELPEPVRAMIDAAIETGNRDTVKAVIDTARATFPDDKAEIDDRWNAFVAERREIAAAEAAQEEEAIRTAGLFERWHGEGQIGAFQSSGNTEEFGVSAALKLEREGIDWTHKLRAAVDYRRGDGVTTREQFLGVYEPRYQIGENLFAYGLAQYERDTRQRLNARYAVSGGFGYKVLDSDDLELSIKAGPAYRITDYIDGPTEERLAALAGADFSWRITDTLKFTQSTNAVAETGGEALILVDSSNTTLNLVTGLEAGLLDRLTARFSYQLDYDSNPPSGAASTDTLSRFTLVYGF
ncbi:DUF481 domain-containing protein [Aurantiacibacter spongiae]|uniref:DUF481 domain-containing protein n=1 Tax=Aurantiacibacter spongiae TaxID=2488860 RepID=A0A3N5CSS6_9SPHN|nr:DUF481 domain-containing protein [Aurantiacibacter spongiae]RPF70390.1 DUF481 domain-containing protein [Aurantiacibacter spongiae]